MSKSKHILALVAAAALVAGCAGSGGSAGGSTQSAAELDALTQQIVKQSFHDKGIVKVADVFRDDETCTSPTATPSSSPTTSASPA